MDERAVGCGFLTRKDAGLSLSELWSGEEMLYNGSGRIVYLKEE